MALKVHRFDDPAWRKAGATVPEEVSKVVSVDYVAPAGLLLVGYDVETPEKVIATAGFRRVTAEVCEVRNMVVLWGHQSRGIGKEMMAALLKEARAAGYTGIRAEAAEAIGPLVKFYEKMGFARAPANFQRAGWVRLERGIS